MTVNEYIAALKLLPEGSLRVVSSSGNGNKLLPVISLPAVVEWHDDNYGSYFRCWGANCNLCACSYKKVKVVVIG